MNKYQKHISKLSYHLMISKIIVVKRKYRDKWLIGGTPINHPLHLSFMDEFMINSSYYNARKEVRKHKYSIDDIIKVKAKLKHQNRINSFITFYPHINLSRTRVHKIKNKETYLLNNNS